MWSYALVVGNGPVKVKQSIIEMVKNLCLLGKLLMLCMEGAHLVLTVSISPDG